MMRTIFVLLYVIISNVVSDQLKTFPVAWQGHWKGTLLWYKTGEAQAQKVPMELHISIADSGYWNWQIIYGKATEDNRPYRLMPKDTAGVHWVIDENNGIKLDQYWVGNRLSGAFTVMNSTIINNYWIEKDKLIAEFYSLSAKPVSTTGNGTSESPSVDSYKTNSYQKAILTKVK